MKKVLVIAPHPDDETLGCGGTLLRHVQQGDLIEWVIITTLAGNENFSDELKEKRKNEIANVAQCYGFNRTYQLLFPTTKLDEIGMGELAKELGRAIKESEAEIVYLPYHGDVHTDHKVVFDVVASCTKVFRYPTVKKILCYETLSETDFSINPDYRGFFPNVYVNIEEFLERKIDIMKLYESELGVFPFPRSVEAIRALAMIRGAASGNKAAEAFMLLKEVW